MNADKIQCFLVDDEPLARQRMKHLLSKFSDIDVIDEFGNGADCIEATLKDCPDLIFLDIGLPDYNGLEVVSELVVELEHLPMIVFATAYDEHALAAFELNALDYLLKPISMDRLSTTVERIRDTIASQSRPAEEEKLRKWMSSQSRQDDAEYLKRVEIKERGGTIFVPVEEVHLFQADGNYIEVHAKQGVSLLRMTMAKLESQLAPDQFVRVSRSGIVAAARVKSIEKRGRHDSWVNLDTGDRVGATRNLDSLGETIKKLG
ncbi:MAG: LytTR family DNA-binding domain-containing protein [Verrucomicrobiota bacterium]